MWPVGAMSHFDLGPRQGTSDLEPSRFPRASPGPSAYPRLYGRGCVRTCTRSRACARVRVSGVGAGHGRYRVPTPAHACITLGIGRVPGLFKGPGRWGGPRWAGCVARGAGTGAVGAVGGLHGGCGGRDGGGTAHPISFALHLTRRLRTPELRSVALARPAPGITLRSVGSAYNTHLH